MIDEPCHCDSVVSLKATPPSLPSRGHLVQIFTTVNATEPSFELHLVSRERCSAAISPKFSRRFAAPTPFSPSASIA
ncbi:hypothetical protein N7466_010811 [Penicillium verhagenii]|uniref:uncharacterized protein n=1 Tax=Penicillium verhagenii TaxID=1562060 RepID=UPI002545209C|nr:uncharacterized protein N7466_010811 [Penicillium verhagenii]KAJ5917257.1 hypothetical protein N7466_010811 [Penicillium verhagenii]